MSRCPSEAALRGRLRARRPGRAALPTRTLAAAGRFANVTSTDYVPGLLERGRERATAERLTATFQLAAAEILPFPDAGYDVVLSTFGVMFTPNQEKAAAEYEEYRMKLMGNLAVR